MPMSSCNKKISEIIKELPALKINLLNADNYYAHLPRDKWIADETIEEHVNLVKKYLIKIIDVHQLDSSIDRLIKGIASQVDVETSNYIKTLFLNAIVFHDYGKINERFQFEKMNNLSFHDKLPLNSPIGSTHSTLSAFLFLTKHLNEIAIEKRSIPILVVSCLFFSYSIFKHHSRCFDNDSLLTITFDDLKARNNWNDVLHFLNSYLDKFQFKIHPNILNLIGCQRLMIEKAYTDYVDSFELYALCRLNYSLLTASDYLATNEYMNSIEIDDFGILTVRRIEELHYNISQREWIDEKNNRINFNKDTYDVLENYEFQYPKEKSGQNLNVLRKEMAVEVIRNIRKYKDCNLFYIEAPTGGGKTNLSMLTTIELLKIHAGKYNKVFYVLPFTTLITQTYAFIRDMLRLTEEEIIEIHSKAGLKSYEEDDKYGSEKA
jgi:CRISPR-associated endonuclease/helicase Cas3